MIVNRKLLWVLYALFIALGVVWWFYVCDWLNTPGSIRAGVVYTAVVVFSSSWHFRALVRFNRATKQMRLEESAGLAPPGSTTFVANQRFRYLMRSIEAVFVLAIGILAIVSVYSPSVALNPNYFRLILTYFIGSILLTGWLTIRDLWVMNRVREMGENDDVALYPVSHSERKEVNDNGS